MTAQSHPDRGREVLEGGRRGPPIPVIVAIVVSLPLFPYNYHKLLHIVGAVLFLGNIIITAGWMTWAGRQKDPAVVSFASAGVNKVDEWFTSPGAILLLLNGLAMTALQWGGWLGFTQVPWIFAGLVLLIATGAVYGTVLRRSQKEMARISAEAVRAGTPLPERFGQVLRTWNIWGLVATVLPLIALYFMVFQPKL